MALNIKPLTRTLGAEITGIAQHFAVMCNVCGAEGPCRPTYEEVGRLWNRRMHA